MLGDDVRTYAELDDRSNRLAHLLDGLGAGDDRAVAVVLPNCLEFFDVATARRRFKLSPRDAAKGGAIGGGSEGCAWPHCGRRRP